MGQEVKHTTMKKTTLVTYATRYGSTREVAEVIGDVLKDAGWRIVLLPVSHVRKPQVYDALVMGTPLYVGRWHREFHRLLKEFQIALTSRPVALFTVGPLSQDEAEIAACQIAVDEELQRYPWLKPVAATIFAGKYEPADLDPLHTLLTKLPASPLHERQATDARDWAKIRAWAQDLAGTL